MSHVEAIRKGLPEHDKNTAVFVCLNDAPEVYNRQSSTFCFDKIDKCSGRYVFLSIGGNFYNIFGLLENPYPFKVDGSAKIDDDIERALIPREMMKDHFRIGLDRQTRNLEPLKEHFSDSKVYHICSPPPVESAAHIQKYPGIFGRRLEMGIAPAGLRKNLYEIQTEVYLEICQSLGITVINPPSESLTDNGFLKDTYLNNDPTHANAKYGALVWSQMKVQMHG